MEQRAHAIVYWPGLSKDIQDTRDRCADCNRNTPSQAATPPIPSPPPSPPFEEIFADFFDYGGCHYLVVGDRLSGWVEVLRSTAGTDLGGSAGLVRHLRTFFATFGVPEELGSDGGPEFTATNTENFLRSWNVRHRVSSVSFPQSNGRAEVAVNTAKRLLMSNTGPTGNLNQDRFLCAILQLRNTPDRDCNLSPAQIIFGRPLRDSLTFVSRLEKFSNPNIRPLWRQAWSAKEEALCTRITRTTQSLKHHSRPLRPLTIGDRVLLQNQHGPNPTKWDRSGLVVESLGHDQYRVKVDGSGRLTLRNRRFLRAYTPIRLSNPQQSAAPSPQSQEEQRTLVPTNLETPKEVSPPTREETLGIAPNVSQPAAHQSSSTPASDHDPLQPRVNRDANPQTQDTTAAPPSPPKNSRPTRVRQAPQRYEPETGTWVRH